MKWPEPWFVTAPRWKLSGRLGGGLFTLPLLAGGLAVLVWRSLGQLLNWPRASAAPCFTNIKFFLPAEAVNTPHIAPESPA